MSAQQSTSDLLASYHAEFINPGWKVLDMTSGLGIDARHICNIAKHVTVCDIDSQIADCAKFNFQQVGIKNIKDLKSKDAYFLMRYIAFVESQLVAKNIEQYQSLLYVAKLVTSKMIEESMSYHAWRNKH